MGDVFTHQKATWAVLCAPLEVAQPTVLRSQASQGATGEAQEDTPPTSPPPGGPRRPSACSCSSRRGRRPRWLPSSLLLPGLALVALPRPSSPFLPSLMLFNMANAGESSDDRLGFHSGTTAYLSPLACTKLQNYELESCKGLAWDKGRNSSQSLSQNAVEVKRGCGKAPSSGPIPWSSPWWPDQ